MFGKLKFKQRKQIFWQAYYISKAYQDLTPYRKNILLLVLKDLLKEQIEEIKEGNDNNR